MWSSLACLKSKQCLPSIFQEDAFLGIALALRIYSFVYVNLLPESMIWKALLASFFFPSLSINF